MAGQNHHFVQYAPEKIAYAIDRYIGETNRLYGVLDKRLKGRDYIAGEYSIADMACYPWIVSYQKQQQKLENFPNLKRWFENIGSRSAVVRAYEKQQQFATPSIVNEESRKILFNQTAKTAQNFIDS